MARWVQLLLTLLSLLVLCMFISGWHLAACRATGVAAVCRWRELPADEKAAYTALFKEKEQVTFSFSQAFTNNSFDWPA